MGRVVGLDLGDAAIGVAISDELGLTAQGLGVVRRSKRSNLTHDFQQLASLLAPYAESVERFVVGLPLNMNGSVGPQAEKAQLFAERLGKHFALPVDTWDERLTTVAAKRTLGEADLSRAKQKRVIDKVAAVFILQGYMDRHRPRS